MTLLLILGAFALLYVVWILFRLATFAVPLSVGLGVATFTMQRDVSLPVSGAAALVAALLMLWLGRCIYACSRSNLLRASIAAIFAVPAGFVGYQLVHGMAGLIAFEGTGLATLSVAGAVAAGSASWRSVAQSGPAA